MDYHKLFSMSFTFTPIAAFAASGPAMRAEGPGEIDAFRIVAAFVVCIAAFAAFVFAVRRVGAMRTSSRAKGEQVSIVDSVTVAPNSQLLVVKFEGRLLLLARSSSQFQLLCDVGITKDDES